jgi:hypothetical protein
MARSEHEARTGDSDRLRGHEIGSQRLLDAAPGPGSEDQARTDPLNAVVVSGTNACGASRLVRTLGEAPGFFLAGEVKQLWARGARDDKKCGCGRSFRSCPFWAEVGRRAFGGWDAVDLERLVDIGSRLHSARAVASLLRVSREAPGLSEYELATRSLLTAVAEVSGARTLIDFSKGPFHALVLSRISGLSVRWVHVVRDPREVAWLWINGTESMKRGAMPDRPLLSTAGILWKWNRYNWIPPALARAAPIPYLRVRFEDLGAEPRATLDRVLAFAGAPDGAEGLPFVDDHTVIVADNDGVPCRLIAWDLRPRYEHGPVRFEAGSTWRSEMPLAARLAVGAATMPMRAAFGYTGRSTSPHG